MKTIYQKAADYIEEHGWTQDAMRDAKGKVCLSGALRECSPQPGDWTIARAVAEHRAHGAGWNGHPNRTQDEVTAWLRAADPITDEELAKVFGPQWREIVALIHRAAVLTPEEANTLAAWDAAWYAAWEAAWDAGREAAGDAGRDVSIALSVRDLIGKRGFTQEHYDVLTMPWRRVIGPIHPDDAPVEEQPNA